MLLSEMQHAVTTEFNWGGTHNPQLSMIAMSMLNFVHPSFAIQSTQLTLNPAVAT